MATQAPNTGTGGNSELYKRLTFLLLALIVYRIGSHVPVPGIDATQLQQMFESQQDGILGMFNMFSGGALSRFSVFAIGIMPYITASIAVQMLGYVYAPFEALKKEGESGRKKLTQYTRYLTLLVSVFQSLGIATMVSLQPGLVIIPSLAFKISAVVCLTTGSMFLMWLGEQITERGLGNGISLIIFAGIVAGLPSALGGMLNLVKVNEMGVLPALFILALVVAVTYFVAFVEMGQRRVLVNYARRQVGNRVMAAPPSFFPMKLNMSGVIPPIFASSVILLPATLASWFGSSDSMIWLKDLSAALSPGQPLYIALYAVAIIFFCFFYTGMVFNSREIADNLKKSGAFVPGIRPGQHTARYLDGVLGRLTFIGAIYITLVCLLPEVLRLFYQVPFYFGGTSLLIIVVVTMDFMAQVQNYMMSHKYDSLLKKANFKK